MSGESPRTFSDCAGCSEMVMIPAGTFPMGSADNNYGFEREVPRHSVQINGFAASKYEITFDDWAACAADGGCDIGRLIPDNNWEFVLDCYRENYEGVPSDGSAWITRDCSQRVMCGGSWRFPQQYMRSAARGWVSPPRRSWTRQGSE